MRLNPYIRSGLGIAALGATVVAWVAVADRHWAAVAVLALLAVACAYPALTGRDPFDTRNRRRKHRRHRSRPSAAPTSTSTSASDPR